MRRCTNKREGSDATFLAYSTAQTDRSPSTLGNTHGSWQWVDYFSNHQSCRRYSLVMVSPLPLSSTQPQGPKMQLHFWQRHPLPWTNPPIHPIYCHHFRCSVDCGICSLPPTHFHLCLHPLKMFVGSSESVAGGGRLVVTCLWLLAALF